MLQWLPGPCPPVAPLAFMPGQLCLTLVSSVSVKTGGLRRVCHLDEMQMPSTCWKHLKGKKERWFSCSWVRSDVMTQHSVFRNCSSNVTAKDKTNQYRSEYCLYSCPACRLKQVRRLCRRSTGEGILICTTLSIYYWGLLFLKWVSFVSVF